ncbi:MAG: hypothetical protein QE279_08635 [Rhodoferax sp.]|nr:hypothetical protein [Rhodoferax sp.]
MAIRFLKFLSFVVTCVSLFTVIFALGIGMDITPASAKRSMDALANAHNRISIGMPKNAALMLIKDDVADTNIDVIEKENIYAATPWSFYNNDGGAWTLIVEINNGKTSAVLIRRQDDALRPETAPVDKE